MTLVLGNVHFKQRRTSSKLLRKYVYSPPSATLGVKGLIFDLHQDFDYLLFATEIIQSTDLETCGTFIHTSFVFSNLFFI